MKLDRLIGILLQQDKITAPELAEKFEVSVRTILRDIDDISKAGIPITTSQGQGGGISIMDGYKIDRTLLSSSEMQAIFSGLKSLDSVSGTNRYRQLMDKLSVSNTINADNHIIIDLATWDKNAVSTKIELIKSSMEQKRIITFRYYSPERTEQRDIEPYRLIFQWSNWYVWGFCVKRQDYRLFKLTRMTELIKTEEAFVQRDVPAFELLEAIRKTDENGHSEIYYSSDGFDDVPEWDYRNYRVDWDNALLKGIIKRISDGYEYYEE